MSRIWTQPHTWKYKEVWTATQLNQEMRDNLEFLKMKPRNYAELRGVANDTPTILTASWTAVNDSNWQCNITTSEANEEVFLYLCVGFTVTTSAQKVDFDILIDNSIYLSSLTATPSTNGIGGTYVPTANAFYISLRHRYVVPSVGSHNFKLRAKTGTSNSVMTFITATQYAMFGVQVE